MLFDEFAVEQPHDFLLRHAFGEFEFVFRQRLQLWQFCLMNSPLQSFLTPRRNFTGHQRRQHFQHGAIAASGFIRVHEERCDGCVARVLQGNWRSGKGLIGIPAVEQIVGHGLTDHERLIIHVVGPGAIRTRGHPK